MIPAGIEPATFRFVAQHLNHCATAVPHMTYIAFGIKVLPVNTAVRLYSATGVRNSNPAYCCWWMSSDGVQKFHKCAGSSKLPVRTQLTLQTGYYVTRGMSRPLRTDCCVCEVA